MKVKVDKFSISINEDKVKSYASKQNFVNDMVKAHQFTKIGEDKLKEVFGDVYDTLVLSDKKGKEPVL
ncbi:hypothetical protein IR083_20950 [Dysgonomonas sp. GY75]|uniref:hypothetical protein n=1 Tax=Dysgonomonas sp. GY75 TaxID=2780419 RepID=UPI0018838FB6|nr:hypothetical protein [Dysgonomonas sp. GY75]MBF0651291.1 hypothetical protein [Dysgonomonas sp. GY75]